MQEIQKASRFEFFTHLKIASECFFYQNLFALSIIALAGPQKDRSAEILLKRMEALTSGNEPTSNQANLKELPLFEFQVLATATDNFSLENKLGQGGFGPVYKVNAFMKNPSSGQEIDW